VGFDGVRLITAVNVEAVELGRVKPKSIAGREQAQVQCSHRVVDATLREACLRVLGFNYANCCIFSGAPRAGFP
jgi:hypothetical protein